MAAASAWVNVMPTSVRLLCARFFGVHFPFFSLLPIFSGGLVKIELTRAAPASLYVSPSRFANRVAGPGRRYRAAKHIPLGESYQ
jgi:hypothetical protein